MLNKLLSIEGNIITKDKTFRGRIEIDESGMISKIGSPTGVADFIFQEELIFPGFIDLHVHAREDTSHSQDYKEDFKTAGEAAINGGVVAFADMPNNKIPPVDGAGYEAKNVLTKKSPVDVLLYAGIGEKTTPLSKKVPYKVFMGPSIGDLFFSTREKLEEAIAKYTGQNVSFHCEDPEIMKDKTHELTHELRRPAEAEISAVDFALELIEKYKIVGKICHCSTAEGMEKIIEAKKRGVKVTVEVTPHHLYFSTDAKALADRDETTMLQVNPPIRQSKENRLALIKLLKSGDIDYLATDHAPHSLEEKKQGISGLTQLDTYGSFVTWLMQEHDFTPAEIRRVCSQNPASFLNGFVSERFGEIKKGHVGSFTVIDTDKPIKITKEILKTKCKWSPFLGVTFPGSVVMTVIKGRAYENK
ncbi:MAG: dihydroorotase [Patescibacteria group bacterium]